MDEVLSLLSVSVDATDSRACVLRVRGEVDISTVARMRRGWDTMVANRSDRDLMIIDLGGVTFFGSTGLAALVEFQHDADEVGLRLRVGGAGPAVTRPLAGTGLASCFDWYPSVDDALDARPVPKGLPSRVT